MEPEGLADHGTVKRFGQGCECEPCAEAARPWRERWDAIEVPRMTPEQRRERNKVTRRQRAARAKRRAG